MWVGGPERAAIRLVSIVGDCISMRPPNALATFAHRGVTCSFCEGYPDGLCAVSDLDATGRMMLLAEAESNLNDITCEFERVSRRDMRRRRRVWRRVEAMKGAVTRMKKRSPKKRQCDCRSTTRSRVCAPGRSKDTDPCLAWKCCATVLSRKIYEHRDEATRSDLTLHFSATEAVTPEKNLRIAFFKAQGRLPRVLSCHV